MFFTFITGGLNSIVTCVVLDLFRGGGSSSKIVGSSSSKLKHQHHPQAAATTSVRTSKLLTLMIGVVVTFSSWWMSFGNIQLVTLSNRVLGSMSGPALGIFVLAIFVPSSEKVGVLSGLGFSFLLALACATCSETSYLNLSAFVISPVLVLTTISIGWLVSNVATSSSSSSFAAAGSCCERCIETKERRRERRRGLTMWGESSAGGGGGGRYKRVAQDEEVEVGE